TKGELAVPGRYGANPSGKSSTIEKGKRESQRAIIQKSERAGGARAGDRARGRGRPHLRRLRRRPEGGLPGHGQDARGDASGRGRPPAPPDRAVSAEIRRAYSPDPPPRCEGLRQPQTHLA